MFICDECKAKKKNTEECNWAGRKASICIACKDTQNKKWLQYAVPGQLGFSAQPPASAIDQRKSPMWLK